MQYVYKLSNRHIRNKCLLSRNGIFIYHFLQLGLEYETDLPNPENSTFKISIPFICFPTSLALILAIVIACPYPFNTLDMFLIITNT